MLGFTNTRESGLESLIVKYLVEQNGYEEGNNADYNKEYTIDETRLFRFLRLIIFMRKSLPGVKLADGLVRYQSGTDALKVSVPCSRSSLLSWLTIWSCSSSSKIIHHSRDGCLTLYLISPTTRRENPMKHHRKNISRSFITLSHNRKCRW